jgi:hypothetical protein
VNFRHRRLDISQNYRNNLLVVLKLCDEEMLLGKISIVKVLWSFIQVDD